MSGPTTTDGSSRASSQNSFSLDGSAASTDDRPLMTPTSKHNVRKPCTLDDDELPVKHLCKQLSQKEFVQPSKEHAGLQENQVLPKHMDEAQPLVQHEEEILTRETSSQYLEEQFTEGRSIFEDNNDWFLRPLGPGLRAQGPSQGRAMGGPSGAQEEVQRMAQGGPGKAQRGPRGHRRTPKGLGEGLAGFST